MTKFDPEDIAACASEWQDYKRQFEIHLDSKGLHAAEGQQKVGQLLKCMGCEHVATYDTFTWAPAIPAVAANEARGIAAQPEVPAEDKYHLETVFDKFDAHFGVHRYQSIKPQDSLSCTRGPKQSVQNFISELKRKAQHCEYGDCEEGLIVDMLINRVRDQKITEKLMELPDDQLTLSTAIRICCQVELTNSHLQSLNSTKNEEHFHLVHRGRGSRRRPNDRHETDSGQQECNDRCNRCCRQHYPKVRCPALDRLCGTCGQKGHYQQSPMCHINKSDQGSQRGYRRSRGRGRQQNRGRGRGSCVYYADDQYYDDSYAYDDNKDDESCDVDDGYDELCEPFDGICETKSVL